MIIDLWPWLHGGFALDQAISRLIVFMMVVMFVRRPALAAVRGVLALGSLIRKGMP